MTLRRRLLIVLVGGTLLAWTAAAMIAVPRARHEVNELFDTGLIRLARQAQSLLSAPGFAGESAVALSPSPETITAGEAEMEDLAIAAWDRDGRLRFSDREGATLPRRDDRSGFVDLKLGGEPWRVYYLHSFDGELLVAAGQKSYERDEMVFGLVLSQLLPWLIVLPILLVALALGVQRALAPLQRLVAAVGDRDAHDLRPIRTHAVPGDLLPMVEAVNALFGRIDAALERERAFTDDAAHELRTPLAVLHAQWDVLRRAAPGAEREAAAAKLGAGLERMERLVTQMLALARLDSGSAVSRNCIIDWPKMVENVSSDCLALAEARSIELACEWPSGGEAPIALRGDPDLVRAMLRNLLDNAVRYSPAGSTATIRIGSDYIEVENEGEPLGEDALARLGERFFRPAGSDGTGSGLGSSIVKRIAALHGLEPVWAARPAGGGVVVTLRAAATSLRAPSAAGRVLPLGARHPRPGVPGEAAPRVHVRDT